MSGRIVTCSQCGRKFKVPDMIWQVFPTGYDHSACAACNRKFADVPCFEPLPDQPKPLKLPRSYEPFQRRYK